MFNNIPNEIRAWPQWVLWREVTLENGRITKVPYDPKQQRIASVTDPDTWSTFDHAHSVAVANGLGLGFVLTEQDPYTFIDLDDHTKQKDPAKTAELQRQIYSSLNTYSEVSPSGKGLHIIAKGKIPKGRRRHGVEVYSTERYMTMTGNVWNPAPPTDCQPLLNDLYETLGGEPQVFSYQGTFEDKETDRAVYDHAASAVNGEKFLDLWRGEWSKHYPSQSEADFALVNILAYYTTSRFQITRLFRMSSLGQRDKAQRDNYINGMIDRSFDRHLPPIDIDGLRQKLEAEISAPATDDHSGGFPSEGKSTEKPMPSNVAFENDGHNPYLRPVPGLVGEIAYWIYQKSPRPVPEIALSAAIALISGIAGRAYNVSGTGLNQYILMLAPTGRGKEVITSGINALMASVMAVGPGKGGCPGASEFVGPERVASGQALIKHLDRTSRSFVSIMGEFDNTLKTFTARNANSALIALKQSLLSLYSRSGRGNVVNPTIYSEKDKNTAPIQSPAVTIIGEGTPERFYSLLDETMVADGLLPRFTIIEYNGPRPPLNEHAERLEADPALTQKLAQLCSYALMLNQSGTVLDVQYELQAKTLLDGFNVEADRMINTATNETVIELWNRAHLKALKLAAVIAVGNNMQLPTITAEIADYAIACVRRDTSRLVSRFMSGDIGDGEAKQMAELRKLIGRYYATEGDRITRYKVSADMHRDKIIAYRFLQARTANMAAFKNDRIGATNALDRVLRSLVDAGVLRQLGHADVQKYGNYTGRYYILTDGQWLSE